jgi:hypothetical protein
MESHTIRVLFSTRNTRRDANGPHSHGWRRGLPCAAATAAGPIPAAGAVGYRVPPLALFPRLAPWATVCRRWPYSHGWRRGLPYIAATAAGPIPTAGAVGYRVPPLALFPRLAPWATVFRRYRGWTYSHGWRRGLPYIAATAAAPIPTAGAVGYRISPLPRLDLFPRLAPWATVYRR